jgi:dihydrolipoamide dehydrogenase
MKKLLQKIFILIFLVTLIVLFKQMGWGQYFTLSYLKQNQVDFLQYYQNHKLLTLGSYFGIYILATALSLPGATILTLGAGALFGLTSGLIMVSFASTIGATLAFFMARFLLQDWVQDKFQGKMEDINQGIEKEGPFYLFTLRLIPIFPFFMINLVMGLTKMKTVTYFLVSQIGMLPGTLVYVNAGTQLAQIESLKGILTFNIILSFSLLGIFPLIAKYFISFLKKQKVYKGFKKPKSFDYNMIAIGGGSAGLVTSYISAAVKANVALIEKNKMGGDCLNTGCVPSKALIKSAKIVHNSKKAKDYGLDSIDVKFDFKKVMERVQNVIKKIEPHDSIERYTELGVDCIQGAAEIISPWEVKVNGKTLTTKNITIATGASPFIPPIPGVDLVSPLTSENLWELKELPKRFVVLGGGPIGAEMAQSFARLGSEVYLIEMLDRIISIEDPIVSEMIKKKFEEDGIKVLTGHKASEFKFENNQKVLIAQKDGKDVIIEFDQVLVAIGRKANTKGFGLENLNVEMRPNGSINANDYLQTNYPNIYVCGDVTGPFQLTHTAAHQAWFCAVNGLFGSFKKFKVDYDVIPWCTYTDPEIATVGVNETMAKKKGISYELTEYGIDDLDRAIADNDDYGVVRVLTVPGSDKILGATIVGSGASNLLLEFISAMKHGFGLNKILGTIHIYPTMGEANKYLAGNWKKKQVSLKTLGWLKKFHKFTRS